MLLAAALLALWLAGSCGIPAKDHGDARVIGPGVAPALMPLLVAGGFKVSGISVANNVVAGLCDVSAHCFEARLSDPQKTCVGEVVGPWCLSLDGAAPPDATRSALRDILARQRSDEVWSVLRQPVAPAPLRWTSAEGTDTPYYLLGLALVLGPFALGWILGLAFLRLASGRVRPLYFTLVVVIACGAALASIEAGELVQVSLWDDALFFTLLSRWSHRFPARRAGSCTSATRSSSAQASNASKRSRNCSMSSTRRSPTSTGAVPVPAPICTT